MRAWDRMEFWAVSILRLLSGTVSHIHLAHIQLFSTGSHHLARGSSHPRYILWTFRPIHHDCRRDLTVPLKGSRKHK